MSGRNQFRRVLTVPNGNPQTWHGNTDGLNGSGLLEPGELGGVLPWLGEEYQLVKLDSGVTASTPTGVAANGQLAFWKDRDEYLVTNDARFADGGAADHRNSVAGVILPTVLAGEYFFVIQKSFNTSVTDASTPATGAVAVANTGAAADITTVAAGTAPTSQPLGTVVGAKSGGKTPIALNVSRIQ